MELCSQGFATGHAQAAAGTRLAGEEEEEDHADDVGGGELRQEAPAVVPQVVVRVVAIRPLPPITLGHAADPLLVSRLRLAP